MPVESFPNLNHFAGWQAHCQPSLAELPPFLRVLLTTDGTVTKSLEAYFWEPVEVHTEAQRYEALGEAHPALGLAATASVLKRQVHLRGRHTGQIYVWANSLLRAELLPEPVRTRLLQGQVGIGELLRDCGLETYRQVLAFGLTESPQGPCVWRSYLISTTGVPFIHINERFLLRMF